MLAVPPIDVSLLSLLNRPGTPWLDQVMVAASNRGLLLFVALGIAVYLWRKSPHGLLAPVLLGLAVAAGDLAAVRVVKPAVSRARPCKMDPEHVPHPTGCGSGKSFPSAHAADTAAAAAIVSWAAPRLSPLALAIALLVGISRVYLGVHWPTDVLGGWALGAVVGAALVLLSRVRYLRA